MTRKSTVLHLKNPFVYHFCGRTNAECRTFQTTHPAKPAARNLDQHKGRQSDGYP
jgi:hypothetical protein